MKRREFIAALSGAMAWPLAAGGQEPERMRRVGVLMALSATDPESSRRLTARETDEIEIQQRPVLFRLDGRELDHRARALASATQACRGPPSN